MLIKMKKLRRKNSRERWEACCLANSLEAPALLLLRATPTRFKLSSHHLEKQTSIFYPFQLVIPLLIFLDSQPHTVVNQLYQQTPGHHLQVNSRLLFKDLDQPSSTYHSQLHAVHNTSYQSTNSTLETCLESDENDLDDLTDVQL